MGESHDTDSSLNWFLLIGWNSGTDDRVGAKTLVSTAAGSLKN